MSFTPAHAHLLEFLRKLDFDPKAVIGAVVAPGYMEVTTFILDENGNRMLSDDENEEDRKLLTRTFGIPLEVEDDDSE